MFIIDRDSFYWIHFYKQPSNLVFFSFLYLKYWKALAFLHWLSQWRSLPSLLQNRETFPSKTRHWDHSECFHLRKKISFWFCNTCVGIRTWILKPHAKEHVSLVESAFPCSESGKKKSHFFVCNLGFVLFSSNQMLYFERLFSFLATMTMKTMACLNVIKWRILSLLWAPLDVVRLPEEWSLMKKTVVYNTGKVYCWITYLS